VDNDSDDGDEDTDIDVVIDEYRSCSSLASISLSSVDHRGMANGMRAVSIRLDSGLPDF
jgi:hypothetical protein